MAPDSSWWWVEPLKVPSISTKTRVKRERTDSYWAQTVPWASYPSFISFSQQHEKKTWVLWCWRRLLRVPWTARRSNQLIAKEISPEYIHWKDWYWSWSSNTLATWCKEPTHLEKTLMLGKIEGRRRWGWQRMKWFNDSMDISLSRLWEMVKDREAGCATVHVISKSRTRFSDWTTIQFRDPPPGMVLPKGDIGECL